LALFGKALAAIGAIATQCGLARASLVVERRAPAVAPAALARIVERAAVALGGTPVLQRLRGFGREASLLRALAARQKAFCGFLVKQLRHRRRAAQGA